MSSICGFWYPCVLSGINVWLYRHYSVGITHVRHMARFFDNTAKANVYKQFYFSMYLYCSSLECSLLHWQSDCTVLLVVQRSAYTWYTIFVFIVIIARLHEEYELYDDMSVGKGGGNQPFNANSGNTNYSTHSSFHLSEFFLLRHNINYLFLPSQWISPFISMYRKPSSPDVK